MKLFVASFLLAAGLTAAQVAPEPKLLREASLAPGDLTVSVWDHVIETRDGPLRCWTYVSKGLEKHGQREVVLTVRRTPDLELYGFPEEIFVFYETIRAFAAKGQTANDHGFTVLARGSTVLGRKGDWGFMYLPAISFGGIDIPPNALAAVLVRDFETELIQNGLHYRVATAMAGATRYYPYPPWSDPDREALVTEERFAKSILSQVPVRTVSSLTARVTVDEAPTPEERPPTADGQGNYGSDIILAVDRESRSALKAALAKVPKGGALACLTDPDPVASSRLYWDAASQRTIVLEPLSGPGRWTMGGFVIFGRAAKGLKPRIGIIEDGFVAVLPPPSWKKLTTAIDSGLPVELPRAGEGYSLKVEFGPEGPPAKGRAAELTQIILYTADPDLEERGVDAESLKGYMDELLETVAGVLAGRPRLDAKGLMVAVAVKPGPKVKVWCEAAGDSFPPEILRKLEAELAKVRPIPVRKGPVAFAMAGSQWTAAGTTPGLPKAWLDVAERSGKPLSIDEIIAILWKD